MSPRVEVHAADMGGCGHYRLIWPATALYEQGADVEVITPEDARSQIICRVDTANGLLRYAGAELEPDLIGLNRLPDADVVVLQRPLTAQLVEVIRFLKAAGRAVVVEVDDDFETIDPDNVAWRTVHPSVSPARNWRHLRAACQLADLVTVTTPALAARYGKHGRVAIIPNMVPSHYLHIYPEHRAAVDGSPVRVGWSGSVDTHPRDLQVTRGAVAGTLRRHGLTFHLVGSGKVYPRDPRTGAELRELDLVTDARIIRNLGLADGETFAHTGGWLPLEKYPRAMAELDVGIVPLADTAFNEAKSWLKGLEFSAVGVPFVATPTGPYAELHAAGAGVLARKPADWRRHLDRLVTDVDYREELADAGRRVAARYVIQNNAERWLDAWTSALDHSVRNRVDA